MSTARLPALGTLRERVQLLRKSQSIGSAGGHKSTYVPLATVWARVRSLAGSLGEVSGGRTAKVSHTVAMRYRADLGPGDRIIYRSRALEILSAEDMNGRRAYLSCRCSETSSTG